MFSGGYTKSKLQYEIPDLSRDVAGSPEHLAAVEAVIRLDERARCSPLRDGWRRRLLYGQAAGCTLAEGELIHLEDLVLLDGGAYDGPGSVPLAFSLQVLQAWRRALLTNDPAGLLVTARPGLEDEREGDAPGLLSHSSDERELVEPERMEAWRRALQESRHLSPLLAAGVVWDAWLSLNPEGGGAWRATLLAALVLRARGMTNDFLLPIDTGRRFAPYRTHPNHGAARRIMGFLSWADAAAKQSAKELDRLTTFERQLLAVTRKRRKNSRLPELVFLLLSRPLISIPMAAKHLGVSSQAVAAMMKELGSIPRPLTERTRYRVWGIV